MRENGKIRQGFTLVEMLIATGIFLVGFVSVYGLFLSGVQYRRRSESTARGAVAASSIIARIRYQCAIDKNASSNPVTDYIGDGDASNHREAGDDFLAYPDQPGMFYRVTDCRALYPDSSAIKLSVQTVWLGAPQPSLSEDEVARRLGHRGKPVRKAAPTDPPDLLDLGLVQEQVAILYRR